MVRKVKRVRVRKQDNSGLFIPAGLLIGIGVGFLVGQVLAGTLIGLGVGFLLMALFRLAK